MIRSLKYGARIRKSKRKGKKKRIRWDSGRLSYRSFLFFTDFLFYWSQRYRELLDRDDSSIGNCIVGFSETFLFIFFFGPTARCTWWFKVMTTCLGRFHMDEPGVWYTVSLGWKVTLPIQFRILICTLISVRKTILSLYLYILEIIKSLVVKVLQHTQKKKRCIHHA